MTKFDDNLWREIERKYGSALSRADGPLSAGSRRRVPVIAGTSVGVAGASAAAVIVLSAGSPPPAFAVTSHPDGTVSVVIRRVDGIAGANQRLAQLGIRARAVRVDEGCQAPVAQALKRVTVATLKRGQRANWVSGPNGKLNARIRPAKIARDQTLVIAAVPGPSSVRLVRGRAVRGAIPGCIPPAVMLQNTAHGAGRVITCAPGGPPLNPRPVAPGTATNTTTEASGTDTTTTAPGTNTTTTGPGTNTTTNTAGANTTVIQEVVPTVSATGSGTTTNSSTTTNATGSQTTTGTGTAAAPSRAEVLRTGPPPFVQACIGAAQRAIHVPPANAKAHGTSP